jgi:teichuronic acid biosynthesis glycosyltransferase TuaG
MPLVSVVMPNYNGGLYIEAAIESVRAQSFADLELLIADDGSTDGSMDLVLRLAEQDKRVRLVTGSESRTGPAKTRNRAIAEAVGRYVAFLDSDDLWDPRKLDRQLALQRDTSCKLTFTALRKMNAAGNLSQRIVFPKAVVTYHALLARNYLPCSSVIVDRSLTGDFRMPDIFRRQDFALWLQLLRDGGVAHGHPEPLLSYRVYAEQFSASKSVSALFHWKVLREHENIPALRASVLFARYAVGAGSEFLRGRFGLN